MDTRSSHVQPRRASGGAARSSDLRGALIGYGLAGATFHAPLIAATPGLSLAIVVTSDAERGACARSDHPGVQVAASVDDVWTLADALDLVVIASPNRTHAPLARAALEAGLAVVVDKPLAATADAARSVVDEAERRGLLLTVFQNRRWDGDFLTLKRLLAAGELGDVLRFESRFERWRPLPKSGWRESGEAGTAGGILYDLGSHLIDQALHLFGPVTRVYAEVERRRAGVQVDDDTFVALSHASGVQSHLWMSAVAAQSGPRFRVLGSRAAWVKHGMDVQEEALRSGGRPGGADWGVEPASSRGHLGAGDAVRVVPTEPGAWPQFYAELVGALRGNGGPPVNPADAVAVLDIIEAAFASASSAR